MVGLSWATHLNQSPESKWFVPRPKFSYSFAFASFCSHHRSSSHAFPPTHTLCREKQNLCWVLTSQTMRNSSPDDSGQIGAKPFPSVPEHIVSLWWLLQSRNNCNKTTFWSNLSSHPYPFVFSFLDGGKRKTLAKLPWCIISKCLPMKAQTKQPFLLEERKEQKWKEDIKNNGENSEWVK